MYLTTVIRASLNIEKLLLSVKQFLGGSVGLEKNLTVNLYALMDRSFPLFTQHIGSPLVVQRPQSFQDIKGRIEVETQK